MNSSSTVLIVEDSPEDYEACVAALTEDNNLANPIDRCETGDEALEYLYGRGAFAADPPARPCMILLDLNLPGTDGRDVLRKIKADDTLKKIPVIVMTTSRDQRDIDTCYRDGANSFVVKPVDLEGFFTAIAGLRNYWFEISVLPKPL